MNLKQSLLFFLCSTIYKPIDLMPNITEKRIEIGKERIEYIKDSTFNLMIIHDEIDYYFRECRMKYKFDLYLKTIIKEYIINIAKDDLSNSEKKALMNLYENKKAIKKIYNLGVVNDSNSIIYKFFITNDYSLLGLSKYNKTINIDKLRQFAQYLWGEIYYYRLNCGVHNNHYQSFCAVRQVATKRIADLLGLGYLIPNTELCTIKIDNSMHFGTIMDKAEGINPNLLTRQQRALVTPTFQHECSNLNILDVICHERDHRPGNYYVSMNAEGFVEHLKAFDNDSPMSFFLTPRINFSSYWASTPLVDVNTGLIKMPYMDKRLAYRILKLSYLELNGVLENIMTKIQIYYVWKRIKALKKSIMITCKKRKDFLLCDENWNEETVNKELSSQEYYGYLRIFKESQKREKLMGKDI